MHNLLNYLNKSYLNITLKNYLICLSIILFSGILKIIFNYLIKNNFNTLVLNNINLEIKKQFLEKNIDFAYPTQSIFIEKNEN